MRTAVAGALWLLAALAVPASAGSDTPGEFDYWVLALSWSPQYCDSRPGDRQCVYAHDFVVHGLWPQYERGFPDFCEHRGTVPEATVERMLPLMPSEELIRYQWRKHGSCSGLPLEEYFMQVERARRAIAIPPAYRNPTGHRQTSLAEIEREFAEVNPGLTPAAIAVQCSGRWLREVRICFDKAFQPRACGADVTDRCGSRIVMRPNRKARGER